MDAYLYRLFTLYNYEPWLHGKKTTEWLTEYAADLGHRLEHHIGVADRHLDSLHVGQLQEQRLVLRRVAQVRVRLGGKQPMALALTFLINVYTVI